MPTIDNGHYRQTNADKQSGFTGRLLINNQPFSCTETWKIPLNAVEEWEVYNHTEDPHPFHIHINPFQVVSGGDVEPGIWLDTLELPPFERITFRTRFSTYTGKFVFHCHNLTHEDMGMMRRSRWWSGISNRRSTAAGPWFPHRAGPGQSALTGNRGGWGCPDSAGSPGKRRRAAGNHRPGDWPYRLERPVASS